MTITNRISTALVAYLTPLVSGVEIVPQINAGTNEEFANRIVVIANSASELSPALRHVFRVSGTIVIQQSADTEDPETTFNTICSQVVAALRNGESVEVGINISGTGVSVYNKAFHVDNLKDAAGPRGFQAVIAWRLTAQEL